MNTFGNIIQLLGRGLILDVEAYDEAAESDNPFVEGLFLLVVIGLIIAVAGVIGAVLGWATTPDMAQMKEIVLRGLTQMPWFDFFRNNPNALEQFNRNYDLGWQIARFLSPNPLAALAGMVVKPLALIIGWAWFSLIAQVTARVLGGNGEFNSLLGAAALASAPALLNVLSIIPTASIAAVGVWTLLARYVAVRRVHENLTWGRVLVATLAPSLVLILLALVLLLLFVLFSSVFFAGWVS